MRRHEKIHRLNLELGPKSFQALTRLQNAVEASSQVEAIRLALQILDKLVRESGKGGKVIIERRNGEQLEVLLPLAYK